MPITPAKLATRQKPIAFEYLGEPVNVSYYPAAFTHDILQEMQDWLARINSDGVTEAEGQVILRDFGAWCCALIASWDYCEDDGVTPQALTPENLAAQIVQFPDFIMAVLMAIVTDRNQGNATGTTPSPRSGATSLPTASLTSSPVAASLNPSRSSSRRAGSKVRRASNG